MGALLFLRKPAGTGILQLLLLSWYAYRLLHIGQYHARSTIHSRTAIVLSRSDHLLPLLEHLLSLAKHLKAAKRVSTC